MIYLNPSDHMINVSRCANMDTENLTAAPDQTGQSPLYLERGASAFQQ